MKKILSFGVPFFLCYSLVLPLSLAAEQAPVKIGLMLSLSGEYAPQGQKGLKGAQLAVKNFPAQKFELSVEDSGGGIESNKAVAALQRLIGVKGIHLLIGPNSPDQALGIAPIARSKNIPVVSLTLCTEQIRKLPQFVCTYPDTEKQLQGLPKLFKDLSISDMAVVLDNSEFGNSTDAILQKLSKEQGIKITVKDLIPPEGTDFLPILTKIQSKKPQAVFVSFFDPSRAFSFFRQLKERGYQGSRIAFIDVDEKYLKEFGSSLEGILLPGFASPSYEPGFAEAYRKEYNEEPDYYSGTAYDVVNGTLNTLQANTWSTEGILDKLPQVPYPSPATKGFRFLPDHSAEYEIQVWIVRNGKFETYRF